MKTSALCLMALFLCVAPTLTLANEEPKMPSLTKEAKEQPSLDISLKWKDKTTLEITLRNNGKVPIEVFKKAPVKVLAAQFICYIKNKEKETLYELNDLIEFELIAGTFEYTSLQPGQSVQYEIPLENFIPLETFKNLPKGPKTLTVEYAESGFNWKKRPTQTITLD